MAAARYDAINPVRARLVERAEDWPWSSVRAHLAGRDDGLVETAPLLSRCGGRFEGLIAEEADALLVAALRASETIGRPLGSPAFLDWLAALAGRDPRPIRRGRKRRLAAQAGLTDQTLLLSKKDRQFLDRCAVVLYLFETATVKEKPECPVPSKPFRLAQFATDRSGRGAAGEGQAGRADHRSLEPRRFDRGRGKKFALISNSVDMGPIRRRP